MHPAFVKRWHSEMSYFHLPHGEMSITHDDESCLLYLAIKARIYTTPRLLEMMVYYLGVGLGDAIKEIHDTQGFHTRFGFLERLYAH